MENKLKQLNKELAQYPEGALVCNQNGSRYKWFFIQSDTRRYLPKSNLNLARNLAHKKYIEAQISDLQKEQQAISAYLKVYDSSQSQLDIFLQNPEFIRLTSDKHPNVSQEISEWLSETYVVNTFHPENLKHKSASGHLLRSKSEADIDNSLYLHNIPFRYDEKLTFGREIVCPDFTIKHPRTGKIYYWEHVGLLDDYKYRQRYLKKLDIYISNGIYPSINLIQTYETYDAPFSSIDADKIVNEYFL